MASPEDSRSSEREVTRAHDRPAGPQGPGTKATKTKTPALRGAPQRRGVCTASTPTPPRSQLGPAQGGPGPADQRRRGHRLHPGRGPQPAGALDRPGPRRPGQGPARASATRSSAAPSTPRASASATRPAAATAPRRSPDAPQRTRPPRELRPDPVYHSVLVTQVVNKVLTRGKRTLAERIVYDALRRGRQDRATTR